MLTVEPATPEALADVRALLAAFSRAVGEPVARDEAWARIERAVAEGKIEFHVAREDGVAVGLASLSLAFSTYRAAPFAVLDDVYVAPDRRGRGVARALVESLLAAARRRGCASALGGCSADDVPRWERLGFRRIGTMMAHDL